jgi:hypothetical protein
MAWIDELRRSRCEESISSIVDGSGVIEGVEE